MKTWTLEQSTEQTVPTMENVQSEQTMEDLKLKTEQTEQTKDSLFTDIFFNLNYLPIYVF